MTAFLLRFHTKLFTNLQSLTVKKYVFTIPGNTAIGL